jgi:hypothetical protein
MCCGRSLSGCKRSILESRFNSHEALWDTRQSYLIDITFVAVPPLLPPCRSRLNFGSR